MTLDELLAAMDKVTADLKKPATFTPDIYIHKRHVIEALAGMPPLTNVRHFRVGEPEPPETVPTDSEGAE